MKNIEKKFKKIVDAINRKRLGLKDVKSVEEMTPGERHQELVKQLRDNYFKNRRR
jgi:hypothetical protein